MDSQNNYLLPGCKNTVHKKYKQDAFCRTWEVLADAIYPQGLSNLRKRAGGSYSEIGKAKCEWADKIGRCLHLHENASPSYQYFIGELEKRIHPTPVSQSRFVRKNSHIRVKPEDWTGNFRGHRTLQYLSQNLCFFLPAYQHQNRSGSHNGTNPHSIRLPWNVLPGFKETFIGLDGLLIQPCAVCPILEFVSRPYRRGECSWYYYLHKQEHETQLLHF